MVRALAQRGWRVTAFARRPVRGVEFVQGDLRDRARLLEAMPPDVDAVFHVAARVDFNASPADHWRDNVEATEHLLEAALHKRARRFVFTSSAGVWGLHHALFDEQSARLETGIAYLDTKLAAEERVTRAVERGLSALILNPGHILGAGSGWSQMFERIGAGKLPLVPPGIASWCDVDALIDAQLAAVERGKPGARYLLGGDSASYAEFAALAARKLQVRAPRRAPAFVIRASALFDRTLPRDLARILCGRLVFSSERAQRELGYRPRALESLVEATLSPA
jgi:nucleoside-diphosphate-sugar epimerase